MDEAALMQRISHEDKAVVLHRGGDEAEAKETQFKHQEHRAPVVQ